MPFFQGEQEAEMQKEVLKEPTYVEELLTLFRAILEKKNCSKKSPIIMRATLRMQWSR